jgi:GH24 family phage-related lysozyme (muramidase)
MARNISELGVQFVWTFEGKRNRPYNDDGSPVGSPGAGGHCTIGIGHLIHEGPCDGRASEAPSRNGISDGQVLALFRGDLAARVAYVNTYIRRELSTQEFDMLVDFTFNCGVGSLIKIAPVIEARGDVCARIMNPWGLFPAYARASLTKRRLRECDLYYTGDYGDLLPMPGGGGSVPIGDDEMWHAHNEGASNDFWKNGKHTFPANAPATLNVARDLPVVMGKSPSAIDFDFHSKNGATLDVYNGPAVAVGKLAGRVDAPSKTIRAVPEGGKITVVAVGGSVTVGLGVLGYLD